MVVVVMPQQGAASGDPALVRIESLRARAVLAAAVAGLNDAVQACGQAAVENERQRRRLFNQSWMGRVLVFLQQDPNGSLTLADLLQAPMSAWSKETAAAHLRMLVLKRAEQLLQRAERADSVIVLPRQDWNQMCNWAGDES